MKKERFFRLLGDLDDAILEKYRQMDVQLSRKAHQKKRTLRVLAVAACAQHSDSSNHHFFHQCLSSRSI